MMLLVKKNMVLQILFLSFSVVLYSTGLNVKQGTNIKARRKNLFIVICKRLQKQDSYVSDLIYRIDALT